MPPKRETKDSTATPADSEQAPENLPTGGEDDASEEIDSKKPSEGGLADATAEQEEDGAAAKARQRQERFKALQARAVSTPTEDLRP